MASEHEHEWHYQQDAYGEITRRCACGLEQDQEDGDFNVPTTIAALESIEQLEQQLAQAQRTTEEYGKMLDQVRRDRIELGQENAQARALLERTNRIFSVMVDVGIRNANQLLEEIRAFLASKEQAHGK